MRGIGLLPDLLDGVPSHRRLTKERADAEYVKTARVVRTASAESLKRDANTWAGIDVFAAKHFEAWKAGETVDFVICARLDLDHPLYFPDNLFIDCADCGCNLQYRPATPTGEHLCICCAARRIRLEASDA